MVKLYDKDFKREDIDDLEHGDVIVYPSGVKGYDDYLIVGLVDKEGGYIYGQVSNPFGINAVSLEKIVIACDL